MVSVPPQTTTFAILTSPTILLTIIDAPFLMLTPEFSGVMFRPPLYSINSDVFSSKSIAYPDFVDVSRASGPEIFSCTLFPSRLRTINCELTVSGESISVDAVMGDSSAAKVEAENAAASRADIYFFICVFLG